MKVKKMERLTKLLKLHRECNSLELLEIAEGEYIIYDRFYHIPGITKQSCKKFTDAGLAYDAAKLGYRPDVFLVESKVQFKGGNINDKRN